MGEPVRSNTTEPEDAPASLVERILADNALDLALYEHAEALYAERGGPLAPTAVAPWAPPD
ncbi:MAG: hypothetical protein R2702_03855 [Acidimicrobiales bacterium]